MKLGVNFKEVGMRAGGHIIGVAGYTALNKLPFMQKQTAMKKGLIAAAIGYLAVPILANKLKLGGKKGSIIQHAGEGMGIVGLMQVAGSNANTAKFVPAISGADDEVAGLGLLTEEYVQGIGDELENVAGYESNPISGEEEGVYGYEGNPMSGIGDDVVSA